MPVQWNRRSYTKEQFIHAWTTSISMRDVAEKLGISGSGSAYGIIRDAAQSLGLSDTHLKLYAHKPRPGHRPKRDLSEILVENSDFVNIDYLRRRLIAEGLLPGECSAPFCPFRGQEIFDPFTGQPRSLRLCLDHIDGNNRNHTLVNLRILCYHCHTMTLNFGSKNQKK